MVDPTPEEIARMERAGKAGGEYLESIGKFDLMELTPDEYATFIRCVINEWTIPF